MKPRFLSKLNVELRTDGRWVLKHPLAYLSQIIGLVTVPAGFDTDFASVPRVPVAFWLTGDCAKEAAVIHDWLYRRQTFARSIADAVLFEASACGMPPEPWWRRAIMWIGVRLFGWAAWRANRRRE